MSALAAALPAPQRNDREFRLEDEDFRALARLVRERAGIVLGDNKRELVYGRLVRRLRMLRLNDFAEYVEFVRSADGAGEIDHLINAITTNLTAFFREPHHFAHLAEQLLQPLAAGPPRRLRIWSAAASSGEEPYSIAMVVRETLPWALKGDVRILATDIDTDTLARGAAGIYPEDRVAGVPQRWARDAWLRGEDGSVEMAGELRDLIAFRKLNLLGPWPMKGPFDAVFCRNVVIYFDRPTQVRLFDRLADILAPDGLLYIGHSENLFGVSDRFKAVGRTTYRRSR